MGHHLLSYPRLILHVRTHSSPNPSPYPLLPISYPFPHIPGIETKYQDNDQTSIRLNRFSTHFCIFLRIRAILVSRLNRFGTRFCIFWRIRARLLFRLNLFSTRFSLIISTRLISRLNRFCTRFCIFWRIWARLVSRLNRFCTRFSLKISTRLVSRLNRFDTRFQTGIQTKSILYPIYIKKKWPDLYPD